MLRFLANDSCSRGSNRKIGGLTPSLTRTKAFQPEQVNALAMTFLRMNNFGVGLVEIFTAIFLFCLGLLALKSKYMPGIIGILLIVGSLGFPINTFTKILIPQFYSPTFTQLAMFGGALGGALPMLWFLIMGVNEPQPIGENHKAKK